MADYNYRPSFLLNSGRLSKYTESFIPKEINPLFLLLYFLNRKIAIKVSARKRLYEELLLMNLSEEMGRIGEAGMLQEIIMRMNGSTIRVS